MIVVATERELQGPLSLAEQSPGFDKLRLVVTKTGVGKSNAAMSTLELLRSHRVDLVVSVGCGGAFAESELDLGDVVVADRVCFADEGVETEAGFLDLEEIKLPLGEGRDGQTIYNTLYPDLADFDPALLPRDLGVSVRVGAIATVSTCSGTDRRAQAIHTRWRPLVEAMEGAAVALAARRCGCPFWEIRGVSNRVGSRDRGSWDIDRACANASVVLREMILKDNPTIGELARD